MSKTGKGTPEFLLSRGLFCVRNVFANSLQLEPFAFFFTCLFNILLLLASLRPTLISFFYFFCFLFTIAFPSHTEYYMSSVSLGDSKLESIDNKILKMITPEDTEKVNFFPLIYFLNYFFQFSPNLIILAAVVIVSILSSFTVLSFQLVSLLSMYKERRPDIVPFLKDLGIIEFGSSDLLAIIMSFAPDLLIFAVSTILFILMTILWTRNLKNFVDKVVKMTNKKRGNLEESLTGKKEIGFLEEVADIFLEKVKQVLKNLFSFERRMANNVRNLFFGLCLILVVSFLPSGFTLPHFLSFFILCAIMCFQKLVPMPRVIIMIYFFLTSSFSGIVLLALHISRLETMKGIIDGTITNIMGFSAIVKIMNTGMSWDTIFIPASILFLFLAFVVGFNSVNRFLWIVFKEEVRSVLRRNYFGQIVKRFLDKLSNFVLAPRIQKIFDYLEFSGKLLKYYFNRNIHKIANGSLIIILVSYGITFPSTFAMFYIFCSFLGSLLPRIIFSYSISPIVLLYSFLFGIFQFIVNIPEIEKIMESIVGGGAMYQLFLIGVRKEQWYWLAIAAHPIIAAFTVFSFRTAITYDTSKIPEKKFLTKNKKDDLTWQYLEESVSSIVYIIRKCFHSLSLYTALLIIYFADLSMSQANFLVAIYMLIFFIFFVSSWVAGKLWVFLLIYAQFTIIIQYLFNIYFLDHYQNRYLKIIGLFSFSNTNNFKINISKTFWTQLWPEVLIYLATTYQFSLLFTHIRKPKNFAYQWKDVLVIFRRLGNTMNDSFLTINFYIFSFAVFLIIFTSNSANLINLLFILLLLILTYIVIVSSETGFLFNYVWYTVVFYCCGVFLIHYLYQMGLVQDFVRDSVQKIYEILPFEPVTYLVTTIGLRQFKNRAIDFLPYTMAVLSGLLQLKSYQGRVILYLSKIGKRRKNSKKRQSYTIFIDIARRFFIIHSPKLFLISLFLAAFQNPTIFGIGYFFFAFFYIPFPKITSDFWLVSLFYSQILLILQYFFAFDYFNVLKNSTINTQKWVVWLTWLGFKDNKDDYLFTRLWEVVVVIICSFMISKAKKWKRKLKRKNSFKPGILLLEFENVDFQHEKNFAITMFKAAIFCVNHFFDQFGFEICLAVLAFGTYQMRYNFWGLLTFVIFGIIIFTGRKRARFFWFIISLLIELNFVIIYCAGYKPFPLVINFLLEYCDNALRNSPLLKSTLNYVIWYVSDNIDQKKSLYTCICFILFFLSLQQNVFSEKRSNFLLKKKTPSSIVWKVQRKTRKLTIQIPAPSDDPRDDFTRSNDIWSLIKLFVFSQFKSLVIGLMLWNSVLFEVSLPKLLELIIAVLVFIFSTRLFWRTKKVWVWVGFSIYFRFFLSIVSSFPRQYFNQFPVKDWGYFFFIPWLIDFEKFFAGFGFRESRDNEILFDFVLLALYYVQERLFDSDDYIYFLNYLYRKKEINNKQLKDNILFRAAKVLVSLTKHIRVDVRQVFFEKALKENNKLFTRKTTDVFSTQEKLIETYSILKNHESKETILDMKEVHKLLTKTAAEVASMRGLEDLKRTEIIAILTKIYENNLTSYDAFCELKLIFDNKRKIEINGKKKFWTSEAEDGANYLKIEVSQSPNMPTLTISAGAPPTETTAVEVASEKDKAKELQQQSDEKEAFASPSSPYNGTDFQKTTEEAKNLPFTSKGKEQEENFVAATQQSIVDESLINTPGDDNVTTNYIPLVPVMEIEANSSKIKLEKEKEHAKDSKNKNKSKKILDKDGKPEEPTLDKLKKWTVNAFGSTNWTLDKIGEYIEEYVNIAFPKDLTIQKYKEKIEKLNPAKDYAEIMTTNLTILVSICVQILVDIYSVYISNTGVLCYLVFALAFIWQPNIFKLYYTISCLGYVLIERIPSHYYWQFTMLYSLVSIVILYLMKVVTQYSKIVLSSREFVLYAEFFSYNPEASIFTDTVFHFLILFVIYYHRDTLKKRGDWSFYKDILEEKKTKEKVGKKKQISKEKEPKKPDLRQVSPAPPSEFPDYHYQSAGNQQKPQVFVENAKPTSVEEVILLTNINEDAEASPQVFRENGDNDQEQHYYEAPEVAIEIMNDNKEQQAENQKTEQVENNLNTENISFSPGDDGSDDDNEMFDFEKLKNKKETPNESFNEENIETKEEIQKDVEKEEEEDDDHGIEVIESEDTHESAKEQQNEPEKKENSPDRSNSSPEDTKTTENTLSPSTEDKNSLKIPESSTPSDEKSPNNIEKSTNGMEDDVDNEKNQKFQIYSLFKIVRYIPFMGKSIYMHYASVFNSNFKTAKDYYTICVLVELICFVGFLLAYQFFSSRSVDIAMAVQSSELDGLFVVYVMILFSFMLIDRVIYIYSSLFFKLIFQYFLIFFYHAAFFWLNSIARTKTGADVGVYILKILFFMKCVYLYFSALQISWGYPKNAFLDFWFYKTHWIFSTIYMGYRMIPFLFELKAAIDFSFIKTTLRWNYWLKLEDINAALYYRKADIDYYKATGRGFGKPQSLSIKAFSGGTILVVIAALLFGPLFLFSTLNPTINSNTIRSMELTIAINGFGTVYQQSAKDSSRTQSVAPFTAVLPNNAFTKSREQFAMGTILFDTSEPLLYLPLSQNSDTFWQISNPGKNFLLDNLASENSDLKLSIRYAVSRQYPETKSDVFDTQVADIRRYKDALRSMINGTNPNAIVMFNYNPFLMNRAEGLIEIARDAIWPRFFPSCSLGIGYSNTSDPRNPNYNNVPQSWWSVSCNYDKAGGVVQSGPFFVFQSTKVVSNSLLSFINSFGLLTIYTSFLVTINSMLRPMMSNMVNRIFYEDCDNVDLLRNFVEDIYIARSRGQLELEELMFLQLLEIFKNPSILQLWTKRNKEQEMILY